MSWKARLAAIAVGDALQVEWEMAAGRAAVADVMDSFRETKDKIIILGFQYR